MLDPFHFSTEVRVRLPETDAFGIVFHGYFYTYFDVARMDYIRNLGLMEHIRPTGGLTNTIVHASADFRSPARFDDVLVVQARISRFGRTSFMFEFAITHKGENRLVAEGRTVHVILDEKLWRPLPVPESFRAVVRKFEGPRLVEGGPEPRA
ncbi:MAG TPA: thioesterase family protein [Planctomycetota bacterium]|jgi:acyl-CoA thioester hydrolase|nr:thioesterase family protein [Planctomycetota bacterium]